MNQLSVVFLFYLKVLVSAKDESLWVFIENDNGVENITGLSKTVTQGTNFTLICSYSLHKNENVFHDEAWTKTTASVNKTKTNQSKIWSNTAGSLNDLKIEFRPVDFKDRGTYVCSSKRYQLNRKLKLIVRSKSRKKRAQYNFIVRDNEHIDPMRDAVDKQKKEKKDVHSIDNEKVVNVVEDDNSNKKQLNDLNLQLGGEVVVDRNNNGDGYQQHPDLSSKKKTNIVYFIAIMGSFVLIFTIIVCAARCDNKRRQPIPTTEPPCHHHVCAQQRAEDPTMGCYLASVNSSNQNRSNQSNRNQSSRNNLNHSNRNQSSRNNHNRSNRGNQNRSNFQHHSNPTTTIHHDADGGVTITTNLSSMSTTSNVINGNNLDGFNTFFASNFNSSNSNSNNNPQDMFSQFFSAFNNSTVIVEDTDSDDSIDLPPTYTSSMKNGKKSQASASSNSDLPPSYSDAMKNNSGTAASGSNVASPPTS